MAPAQTAGSADARSRSATPRRVWLLTTANQPEIASIMKRYEEDPPECSSGSCGLIFALSMP